MLALMLVQSHPVMMQTYPVFPTTAETVDACQHLVREHSRECELRRGSHPHTEASGEGAGGNDGADK
jgi:hypothetical protein